MTDERVSPWLSDREYELITKKTPIPTVNLVIIRQNMNRWEVLLLIRKIGYGSGSWCIIGGRVRMDESIKQAINRHARDLGVKVKIISPFERNFPCFIDDRNTQDETKHPISMVYPVKIVSGKIRDEGMEYKGYKWFLINKLPKIAYGQKLQIKKTIEKLNIGKNL